MPSRSLCLILPKEHWPQLQAIRQDHDKEFLNIPPHINILFPLKGKGQSDDEVAKFVKSIIGEMKPFQVTCPAEGLTYFGQRDHCVAHIKVESDGVLENLHDELAKEYPLPPRPVKDTYNYVPHATLGGLTYAEVDTKIEKWKSEFESFTFTAKFVALLTQTKGEAFFVRRLIDIGSELSSEELEREKENVIELYDPREHDVSKVREWVSSEVLSLYQQTRPTPSVRRARTTASRLLSQTKTVQNRTLHEFGSSAAQLDRHDADLDLLIGLITPGEKEDAVEVLTKLSEEIGEWNHETSSGVDLSSFTIIEEVYEAKVPRLILEFKEKNTIVPIDVTVEDIEDPFLLQRPKELRKICAKDNRIRPYLVFVKEWAKQMKICSGVDGHLNGYGWVSVGIFVLRHDHGAELLIPEHITLADMVVSFYKQLYIFCDNRGKLAMDVSTGQYVANDKRYSFYVKDAHLKEQNLGHTIREKTASKIHEVAKNSWSSLQRRMKRKVATTQTAAVLSYARDWEKKHDVNAEKIEQIRILQMNVLADALVFDPEPTEKPEDEKHGDENKDTFQCSDDFLSWEYRAPLILRELTEQEPDIICIQECDHYDDFYRPEMSERGYQCVYKRKRPSGDRMPRDGCAIFFRASKFISVARHDITLRTFPGAPSMHVALVIELQLVSDASRKFFVCVTHLKSGYTQWAEDIRLKQIASLLAELQDICGDNDLIFCADLNSSARERRGTTPKVFPFITQSIEHSLYLRSAYGGSNPNATPVFTHWPGWTDKERRVQSAIDYIFHTQNFRVISVLQPPSKDLIGHERLPNKQHPSDHISLCVDFMFKNKSSKTVKTSTSTAQQEGAFLRTSWDVYNRLKWDTKLPYDISEVFIGYSDWKRGDSEIAFTSFITIANGGDIPFHRIFYFRNSHELLWDRRTRLDRIFGSGNTQEQTTTSNDDVPTGDVPNDDVPNDEE